jgi:hypothetical protein
MLNSSNASCHGDAAGPTPASSNAKSPAGPSNALPTALQTAHVLWPSPSLAPPNPNESSGYQSPKLPVLSLVARLRRPRRCSATPLDAPQGTWPRAGGAAHALCERGMPRGVPSPLRSTGRDVPDTARGAQRRTAGRGRHDCLHGTATEFCAAIATVQVRAMDQGQVRSVGCAKPPSASTLVPSRSCATRTAGRSAGRRLLSQ